MLIDLVSSVTELINRYGLDAVRGTVDYVGKYSEWNSVRVGDAANNLYFTISKDQYSSIRALSNAGDKIQAIKLLHKITACGLKEAKDVVEATRW